MANWIILCAKRAGMNFKYFTVSVVTTLYFVPHSGQNLSFPSNLCLITSVVSKAERLIQAMQVHQKKQETEIQLLKEKTKELEFMNALLSDRLALAQRKQFGSSSADGKTEENSLKTATFSAFCELTGKSV